MPYYEVSMTRYYASKVIKADSEEEAICIATSLGDWSCVDYDYDIEAVYGEYNGGDVITGQDV